MSDLPPELTDCGEVPDVPRLATALVGAAGEHYVMAELLRRRFIAALAPQGAQNLDIIVTDAMGDQLCALQVKTRLDRSGDGGWYMGPKHETLISARLFYCFVDFGVSPEVVPRVHVIPSAKVAEVLSRVHSLWLATPGRNGRARQDSSIRRLIPDYGRVLKGSAEAGLYPVGWMDPYLGAWDSLRAPR